MQSQHNNGAIMHVRVVQSPQTGTGDSIILHVIYMVVPVFFVKNSTCFQKRFFLLFGTNFITASNHRIRNKTVFGYLTITFLVEYMR
jgi:hypothetical protein